MPYVSYFVYCLNIERNGDSVSIQNPISAITPDYVPGNFSFAVAFSVLDTDVTSSSNTIRLIILDENKQVVADTNETQIARLIPEESPTPDKYRGYNFNMDFRNLQFQHNGLYTTQVYFNHEKIYENEIYVCGKNG